MKEVIFLKLGGSLITDKQKPHAEKKRIITNLAFEIVEAINKKPNLDLIIGHGSGSFGHIPAKKYKTREGAKNKADWRGFHEVWREARALDQIILDIFVKAGLRVISYPPSASLISKGHKIISWNVHGMQLALEHKMIPMIYGDVAFDLQTGSTIYSTEELFVYLADKFMPNTILLAGIEDGVYGDFPIRKHLLSEINRSNIKETFLTLTGSSSVDVTGGMRDKVDAMWKILTKYPKTTISIFSPKIPGTLKGSLQGRLSGTILKYE